MDNPSSIIALIPAYNPTKSMLSVLRQLKESGCTVVLVNDGSDAAYLHLFRAAGMADVQLTHSCNRGKGAALKTGLHWIMEHCHAPYTVVTVDADGQHLPEDSSKVAAEAQKHPDALVIGSRKLGKGTPFRSRSGNFFTRTILHALTPVKVYDTQSGLRAFSDRLVPVLAQISGERYEYEMRVLIDLTERHISIKEISIQAVYLGENGVSHFKTVSDAKLVYREIFSSVKKKR